MGTVSYTHLDEYKRQIRTWAARSVATTMAGYGLYAFYRRQIGYYLIMRMHFVFYDYEKGIFPFLLDYLAVMILIAFIGYYMRNLYIRPVCRKS